MSVMNFHAGIANRWARVFAGAVIAVCGLTLGVAHASADAHGTVTESIGEVEIGRGEPPVFTQAKKGGSVNPGDIIRTGRGGRIELTLGAGTVRLYENSLLRVPDGKGSGHQVELSKGRSIFDVIKESVKDRFEIKTPEVVVSVKGTRFEVDLRNDLAQVAVFRGTVGVRAPDATLELETLVRQGFAASGSAGVPFELDLTSRTDPWDSWAKLSTPRETAMNHSLGERKHELHKAAQQAARQSSAKELVEIATKRNPEVAQKVAEMRKERRAAANGGVPSENKPLPAAPGDLDVPSGMKRRMVVANQMEFNNNDLSIGVDPSEVADRIEADREKFNGPSFMMSEDEAAAGIETPEDPAGSVNTGGWDPTPELSMMDVASITTGLSYQELIQLWYASVQDLMENQPEVFAGVDPSQYQSALEQKFIALGLNNSAAQHLAEYIASQINSNN